MSLTLTNVTDFVSYISAVSCEEGPKRRPVQDIQNAHAQQVALCMKPSLVPYIVCANIDWYSHPILI